MDTAPSPRDAASLGAPPTPCAPRLPAGPRGSVPPPPEGWPRSGCSPSRLCLRRSSSRSFVAARAGARGWGEGALARLLPSPGRSSELAAGLEPGGAVGSRGGWGPPRGRASPGVGTGPRRWRRGGGRGWDRSRGGRAAGRLWAAGPHAARFLSPSTLLPFPSLPSPSSLRPPWTCAAGRSPEGRCSGPRSPPREEGRGAERSTPGPRSAGWGRGWGGGCHRGHEAAGSTGGRSGLPSLSSPRGLGVRAGGARGLGEGARGGEPSLLGGRG